MSTGQIIEGSELGDIFGEMEELAKKVYIKDDVMHINLVYDYPIDMARCDSPAKILNWILQLNAKTWMTREALERFILLACKHHGLEIPEA